MSICRSTLSALSHPRTPLNSSFSKTITPFLYQTATIQQWKPIAYRNASSRSTPDDDIPFEGQILPSDPKDAEPARKTTITSTERAAFQKLYEKYIYKEQKPSDDIPFADESDQIADEYYEEEDEAKDSSASLDSVFDAVLSGLPPPGKQIKHKSSKKPAEKLKTLTENILGPEVEQAKKKPKKKKEAAVEAERIKAIREKDRTRVKALLEKARTDRELWEVLEKEVIEKIRALDLDGLRKSTDRSSIDGITSNEPQTQPSIQPFPTKSTKQSWAPKTDLSLDPSSDPRILFPNFPSHLVTGAHLLRTKFPSSQLPLCILPTIESLGRSSYALGATTNLYNILIRTAWIQHSSYDYIDELLTSMDNGGIEFDNRTLGLLNDIISEYEDAVKSKYGNSLKVIWQMEYFWEGIRKLRSWREVARERVVASSERRAGRDGSMARKVTFGKTRAATVKRSERELKQAKQAIAEAEVWNPVEVGRKAMEGEVPDGRHEETK